MGSAGYAVNAISVLLIIFFNIMFMFRTYSPIPSSHHPHPSHPSHPITNPPHSLHKPPHLLNNELQQRNPSRRPDPNNNMVVPARAEEGPGAETGRSVCRGEDCRDAEGGGACGVT